MRRPAARWSRSVSVVVCLLLVLAAAARAQEDTWTGVERVVAVGDVHGDCEQFVSVLRAAKVINDKDNWIAGKTHLVQVGDVLDRWPDSRKAMDLLMKLEGQAAKAGGCVHALIGNHEAMVLLGDTRYVHPGEFMAFGGDDAYRKAMSPTGKYGKWIVGHNAVIKINDIVFLHAGLEGRYTRRSRADLNKAVRTQLRKGDQDKGGVAKHPSGPLWYRGLAMMDDKDLAEDLTPLLKTHQAERVVIGHTFSRDGMRVKAGGRVIVIDVGISRFYKEFGGRPSCLVIEKAKFHEVQPGKKPRPLALPEPKRTAPIP